MEATREGCNGGGGGGGAGAAALARRDTTTAYCVYGGAPFRLPLPGYRGSGWASKTCSPVLEGRVWHAELAGAQLGEGGC
jgi:hypothetical protein